MAFSNENGLLSAGNATVNYYTNNRAFVEGQGKLVNQTLQSTSCDPCCQLRSHVSFVGLPGVHFGRFFAE